jgi:capsular polysaccharide biosynthesis protein
MEVVEILSVMRRRKFLVLLVVLAAGAVAVAVKMKAATVPTGSATVQLLVDSPQSALGDLQQDPTPLATRASEFAQLMTSGSVLTSIAKTAGVSPADITAQGPYSGAAEVLDTPTPSEARGVQLVAEKPRYRVTFVAQTDIPIITASVQAPTVDAAAKVAQAIYPGMKAWLDGLQANGDVPLGKRVTIRELGDVQVGQVNANSSTMLAGVAGFAVALLGLLLVVTIRRQRRSQAETDGGSRGPGPDDAEWAGRASDLGIADDPAVEALDDEDASVALNFREFVR